MAPRKTLPALLRPTNDFVLLRPETVTPYHEYRKFQHIIVPEKFEHGPEDRPVFGVVVARGFACTNRDVKLGSRILIGKWDGARLTYQDTLYILVKEGDILAVDE